VAGIVVGVSVVIVAIAVVVVCCGNCCGDEEESGDGIARTRSGKSLKPSQIGPDRYAPDSKREYQRNHRNPYSDSEDS